MENNINHDIVIKSLMDKSDMRTPIADMLKTVPAIRFCMPGHKGTLRSDDITEIPGADNLLSPDGCIMESQELCAKQFGAAAAFYSTNGSTACALASLLMFKRKVIIAADCHRSAISAVELSGAQVSYIPIELNAGAVMKPVSVEAVKEAISADSDAEAVFLTYPNYYGMCCDLSEIARITHEAGMKLIVDSAHGAHLGFCPCLPKSAGECGADIWFVSTHKTLRALNQTAILFCADSVDAQQLKRSLNLVHTTSPSYPLLASIDTARAEIASVGSVKLKRLCDEIEYFKSKLAAVKGVFAENTDDFTRLVLRIDGCGFAAEKYLYEKGIAIECADKNHIVLICTIADESMSFEKLYNALRDFADTEKYETIDIPLGINVTCGISEAKNHLTKKMHIKDTAGMTAASGVIMYPPGAYVLLPGEKITADKIVLLERLHDSGYNIINMYTDVF